MQIKAHLLIFSLFRDNPESENAVRQSILHYIWKNNLIQDVYPLGQKCTSIVIYHTDRIKQDNGFHV